MIELALHILDIAQNSLRAGAGLVEIVVVEDPENDRLDIGIYDNGCGMTPAEIEKALDPFYSTKKVRRIGLGLPMLKQAALQTDGSFTIESEVGKGTRLDVVFRYNHIDRQPLGDVAGALVALILERPEIDIFFTYRKGSYEYVLDTREIREGLDGVPMNNLEVIRLIRSNIIEGVHSRVS